MSTIPNSTENILQQNCIKLLSDKKSFSEFNIKFISQEDNIAYRGGKTSSVLLKNVMRDRLKAINSFDYKGQEYQFSLANIEKAIEDIDVSLNEGLSIANEKITNMLILGTSYDENLDDNTKKSFSFKYIDWDNIENNHFHLTEEFTVDRANQNEQTKTRRVDLVLFVNGIPLVAIELKKSGISYENGIRQIEKEQKKDEIPHLYKFIQLTIAGNNQEARYGTMGTPLKFYNIWKEDKELANAREQRLSKLITDRTISQLDRTLFSLLAKDRLLDIMQNFILFDKRVKKVARYQQYFGIKATLQRVSKIENGKRAGGLIWHTQGSGKSLTMVMLTRLLKKLYPTCKVIVVTDRVDLDKQIHNTFRNTDISSAKASSGSDLINKLESGVSVITTLIHKFEKVKSNKTVIEDRDIFVLVDESHRSQGGELNKAMEQSIPNGCYLGFTGTPLLKKEKSKNSFAKFGGEIHRYTIDDAVKDKAVLPLLYEGRFVDQEILSKEALDRKFKLITKNLNEDQAKDLEEKWAKFQKVASSEQRLELIALDVNEHFKNTLMLKGQGFKAMLATSSKYEAFKYHEIFQEYGEVRSAVVVSSNEHEELDGGNKAEIAKKWKDTIEPHGGEENYLTYINDEFVHGDEIDLLIVVDKLLTGFDAPKAATLYIDKKLQEHNLLQAIARVNRLFDGKDYGYIVDYRGLLGNLDEALTTYASLEGFDESDIVGAVIDVKKEIEKAKTYYTHLETLFSDVEFKSDMESYEVFLADEEKRELFKEYLSEFAKAFKLALTSDKLEEVLSEEEILTYKRKIKFYNDLRKSIQIRYHEKVDFGKYEEQMQKLLDTFISANEVNELTKLVNVFDTEFDDEVSRIEGKNAKADTILSAVSAVAKEKMESNPAFYKSLAQQIQDIIDDYREKRLSEEEKYEKAQKLKELLLNDEEKKEDSYPDSFGNNKVAKAMYDNLTDILNDIETIDIEKISERLALEFDKIYKEHSLKPEWDKNKDVENEITSDMEDFIWDIEDEYDINIEDKERIYQVIRGIGISFYG